MGDFVEHGKTDLRAQFFKIRKSLTQRLGEDRDFVREQWRIQGRSLRQWHALIDPEESIAVRVEPFGSQQGRAWSLFYNELHVLQLLAEAARQPVDDARHFFSDFAMIQWSGFSPKCQPAAS